MYKFLCFLLCILSASAICAQKTTNPPVKAKPAVNVPAPVPANWQSYTDPANNITVRYPNEWVLKTSNTKVAFILTTPLEDNNDKLSENMSLVAKELPDGGEGVSLKTITDAVEAKIPQAVDNFKLEYSKPMKWLGTDAKEFSYSGNDKKSGTPISFIQRIAINKGRMVLITYTSETGRVNGFKETFFKIAATITCN
jgi:hypothetical protein